jgi:hypothetical protein
MSQSTTAPGRSAACNGVRYFPHHAGWPPRIRRIAHATNMCPPPVHKQPAKSDYHRANKVLTDGAVTAAKKRAFDMVLAA